MVLITSVGYKISKSLEFTVAVLGTTATIETQQNRKVQKITLTLVLKEKEEFVRLERRKHHIKDRRMVSINEQRDERAEDGCSN